MLGGKVVAHVPEIYLTNVEFRVRKTGREKVLLEKCKNVHAFVIGIVCELEPTTFEEVAYNPYKNEHFELNGKPIFNSVYTHLKNNKVHI